MALVFVTGCATTTVVKPIESVCIWGNIVTLTDEEIDALSIESLRTILDNNDGYMATCLKR
ncbi:hypothetical protein [Achromobacter phage nyashin_LB6]|nr:hypothetical protein [Achromobacter phage nyashin_LB6]